MFSLAHFASPVICLASTTHTVSKCIEEYLQYLAICLSYTLQPSQSLMGESTAEESPRFFLSNSTEFAGTCGGASSRSSATSGQTTASSFSDAWLWLCGGMTYGWKSSIWVAGDQLRGDMNPCRKNANFWHLKTEVCGVPVQLVPVRFIASRLFNRMFAVCKQKGVSCISWGVRVKCWAVGMSRVKTGQDLSIARHLLAAKAHSYTFLWMFCHFCSKHALQASSC